MRLEILILFCFLVEHSTFAVSPALPNQQHPTLCGRNLLSVEECLTAYQANPSHLVFIDGSWYHKQEEGKGRMDFENGPRLPNARYCDMDDIACRPDLFPTLNPKGLHHMLPPPKLFAKTMDAFEITNHDHVVIYGCEGTIFTPRTWFLFRTMGHENVHLMQGSLQDWIQAGGPVDYNPTTVPKLYDINQLAGLPSYQACVPTNVVDMNDMVQALTTGSIIIIDPRGSSYSSRGHIPGAIHMPYIDFVEPENHLKLKSLQNLRQLFAKAGVDVHTQNTILTSCGSGVSVCHVVLALEECGRNFSQTKIYDGSWEEWGADPNTPKIMPTERTSS